MYISAMWRGVQGTYMYASHSVARHEGRACHVHPCPFKLSVRIIWYIHIWQVQWRWLCMVPPRGDCVYMIVETLHCFSTSLRTWSRPCRWVGVGALWGMCAHACSHARACTKFKGSWSISPLHLYTNWCINGIHPTPCPHPHPNTHTSSSTYYTLLLLSVTCTQTSVCITNIRISSSVSLLPPYTHPGAWWDESYGHSCGRIGLTWGHMTDTYNIVFCSIHTHTHTHTHTSECLYILF